MGLFRYRIGDWRVVDRVDDTEKIITILLIANRSNVYK
ncbi:type II toxin-antitoxin system RelE family toxin [Dendronalium sp. ChiSLP03b]